jgi:hypothetical protein
VENHPLKFHMPHLFRDVEAPVLRKTTARSPHPQALKWDYSEWRFPQPGPPASPLPEPKPEPKRHRPGFPSADELEVAFEQVDRLEKSIDRKLKPRLPMPLKPLTEGDEIWIEHEFRKVVVLQVEGDRVLVHVFFPDGEEPEPLHKALDRRPDPELLALADRLEPLQVRWHLRKDLTLSEKGKYCGLDAHLDSLWHQRLAKAGQVSRFPDIMQEQNRIMGLRERRNVHEQVWVSDEARPGRSKVAIAQSTPDAIELPTPPAPKPELPPELKPEGQRHTDSCETGDLVLLHDGLMAIVQPPPAAWFVGDLRIKKSFKRMVKIIGIDEIREIYCIDVKAIVQAKKRADLKSKLLQRRLQPASDEL